MKLRLSASSTLAAILTVLAFVRPGAVSASSETCTAPPPVPGGLHVTAWSTQPFTDGTQTWKVDLSWVPVTAPSGCTVTYELYRSIWTPDEGGESYVLIGAGLAGTTFEDTGTTPLVAGENLFYSLRTVDAAGSSRLVGPTWANPICDTDCSPPSIPTGVVASEVTSTSVTLEWEPSLDSVGVDYYRVFLTGSEVVATTHGLAATITGLTPGTTYSFAVTAEDAAGNGSLPSDTIQVSLPGDSQPPSAPTHLAASNVTATSVTLKWSASTDDAGPVRYEVLDAGAVVATSDTTTLALSGLAPRSAHVFTVRAFDVAGNRSAPSEAVAVTTRAAAPCANPKNLTGHSYLFNTTGAVCLRTSKAFKVWNCSNARDRSLEVNGAATTCGKMPLPAKTADGFYYFDFSAGRYPWAQMYWW